MTTDARSRQEIGRYRPYPEYRDTGVEWLGQIPAHWEAKKIKYLARLLTGGTPAGLSNDAFDQAGVPWVKPDDLLGDRGVSAPRKSLSFKEARAIGTLRSGSILVCGIGTIGKYGVAAEVVCTNQQINSITFADSVEDHFAAFASSCLKQEFLARSNKVTISICNKSRMGLVQFPLPPRAVQVKIARFLDRETAKIDALIETKQRLIELLQEKRTALITHAVTKGLDPGVPMKDSGVEWLGEIPAQWDIYKTTWLFRVGSGTTPRSGDTSYYDGEIPWITTSELRETTVLSTEKSVSALALMEYPSLRIHPKGSLAVAMYGATIGRLGILGIDATVNQACCVFGKPRGIDIQFAFYWFQMRRPYLISLGSGGGQPNLNQDLLRAVRIPTPPEAEQKAVVAFLDRQTRKIEELIGKINEAIDHLKEYRTALISAAVTGKIDVREEVA